MSLMIMVAAMLVVLVGVVIGWWTISGSGIHERPFRDKGSGGESREYGESPLDSPWTMNEWSRGTGNSRRKRR
jgi:hypothetical protein